jgi:hypothetical protein
VAKRWLGPAAGAGYVLADANDEANGVCDAGAASGYQLVVAMPHPNAGQGHH